MDSQQMIATTVVSLIIIIIITSLVIVYFHIKNRKIQQQKIILEAEMKLQKSLKQIIIEYEQFDNEKTKVKGMLEHWENKYIINLMKQYLDVMKHIQENSQQNYYQSQELLAYQKMHQSQQDFLNQSIINTIKARQQKTDFHQKQYNGMVLQPSFIYGTHNLTEQQKILQRKIKACGIKIHPKQDFFIKFITQYIQENDTEDVILEQIKENSTEKQQESQSQKNDSLEEDFQNILRENKAKIFQTVEYNPFQNSKLELSKSQNASEKNEQHDNGQQQIRKQKYQREYEEYMQQNLEEIKEAIDPRTPVDKYIDKFWKQQIESIEEVTSSQIQYKVHKFIHDLLTKYENDPIDIHSHHLQKQGLHHQELIMAILDSIKKDLCTIYFKPFTKEMIKSYFQKVLNNQEEYKEIEMKFQQQKIVDKIQKGVDLKIDFSEELENHHEDMDVQYFKKQALDMIHTSYAGIRESKQSWKKHKINDSPDLNQNLNSRQNQIYSFQSSNKDRKSQINISPSNLWNNEIKNENNLNQSFKSLNIELKKMISPIQSQSRKSQILFQTNSIADTLKQKIGHLYEDDVLTINKINKNAVFKNSQRHIIDNQNYQNDKNQRQNKDI